MMHLVIGEHRPHVRHAYPFKLAIPTPCALAGRPSIFERKPVRFHLDLRICVDPRSANSSLAQERTISRLNKYAFGKAPSNIFIFGGDGVPPETVASVRG